MTKVKKRIIPIILYDGKTVIKGKNFNNDRTIGSVEAIANLYSKRRPDEIAFLDVTATHEKRSPNFEIFKYFADKFDIPFVVGGGIGSVNDAKKCLSSGAEKVIIGSAIINNRRLIQELSEALGSQAIVASVDYRSENNLVYSHSGRTITNKDVLTQVVEVQELGAGEILLQDISRDGTLKGLDLKTIEAAYNLTTVPLIVAGGVGEPGHVREAFEIGVSGVGAGAIFQFTKFTPNLVAEYSKGYGFDVRTQTYHDSSLFTERSNN